MQSLSEVEQEAMSLSEADRATLACRLPDSLPAVLLHAALWCALVIPLALPLSLAAQTPTPVVTPAKVPGAFEPAALQNTRMTGYLAERMQLNLQNRLLQIDIDTLLRPFQQRSGGQWWLGEHAGKFLHAGTLAWQFSGSSELKRRLDQTVAKLIATQTPEGYLGTYPAKDRFVERDGINWDGPVWDVWAHKYCLIGLLTYYQATGDKAALNAARRGADLLCATFGPSKKSIGLASSHVGMASTSVLEPMALLYCFTGEPRYLDFCRYIVAAWEQPPAPNLLHSLLQHGNVFKTANNKAYEMLSNLVGLLELYRIEGDPRYLAACTAAWEDIVTRRLYPIGTTSYAEHFTDAFVLPSEARPGDDEPKIGEGCVTVTWLQLNLQLLRFTGAPRYAAALERTLYNALPAAQSPHTGQVCYFLPQNGKRRFGEVSHGLRPDISCCSSSIPRGIALMPFCVAGTVNGNPALLQYEPGTYRLPLGNSPENGAVALRVETDYPASGRIAITFDAAKPQSSKLLLRVPEWAQSFQAEVAGRRFTGIPGQFVQIEREWLPGDTLKVAVTLDIVQHPDPHKDSSRVWFSRGPQLLALDESVQSAQGLSPGWWGRQIYPHSIKIDGQEGNLYLVPFAEAGQSKGPYKTMLDPLSLARSGTP